MTRDIQEVPMTRIQYALASRPAVVALLVSLAALIVAACNGGGSGGGTDY